jgi:general stress protein 26
MDTENKNHYSNDRAAVKSLIEQSSVCFFCTHIHTGGFSTRPMRTQQIDKEGNIWFLSSKSSLKNQELSEDNQVQLLYHSKDNESFLTIHGKGEILNDRQKLKELWDSSARNWFRKGIDDPDISLIKVSPDHGHYWDAAHSQMVRYSELSETEHMVIHQGIEIPAELKRSLETETEVVQMRKN